METSAKAAANGCEGEGLKLTCAFKWTSEEREQSDIGLVSNGGLGEVFNALEAVQGLLYSGVNLVSKEAQAIANSTSPAKASGTPSATSSGTPSGSAAPTQDTGAAGKMTVAWSAVALAGMVAMI